MIGEKIRIGINIDVTPGEAGGIAQSTQGLISSLGQLDGPEKYTLVTKDSEQADWIKQYCGPTQQITRLHKMPPAPHPNDRNMAKRALRPVLNATRWAIGKLSPQPPWRSLPVSDGYYEALGVDVMHFPTQTYTLTALPTIYNPHDLQHLHYPQFWTAAELGWRETVYPAACHFSNTVVVGSEWIKQDVLRHYRLHPDKVQIIPWAPPTAQYPQIDQAHLDEAKQRLALPEAFAFYPAVTWPHKNHIRLLEAIAQLRDQKGLRVNLVCTGSPYKPHWPKVEQRVKDLGLSSQIQFLGFVSESDLRAVYRLSQFLILPTLFEADSCPIHEAWSEGIPVASSNLTALPDQVGDAGLMFDARHVSEIAHVLDRMTTDPALRRDLIAKGHRRVKDFDWTRTAKAYRAVYRRAAGHTLNDEDRWLLEWDWMREPHKTPNF